MDAAPCLTFGALLRLHRRAAGLTQEELADRAGISRRSLGDMERGVPHVPRKETVARLAAALALAPDEGRAFIAARQQVAPPGSRPALSRPALPPLVGRARELALLERHLAGSREGYPPPLLLLAGEPGIGKTRLLCAARTRAPELGWCVLEGGCQRGTGQEPYAPLAGAVRRYLRGQRPGRLQAILTGCAWLVRLVPELAEGPIPPLPPWTLTPAQEQHLMVEAVIRVLANLAGSRGTLLVLDDLQWAGPDALHLLTTLVRSAGEMPLRVVGAYRDTEVQAKDALAVALADLAHVGLVARRQVGPLAPEEAAQVLDGVLAGAAQEVKPAVRERVLRQTGGVPFFLVSCAQGVLRHEEEEQAEAVPWDVAQSVRQRVATLPDVGQEILGVAAVVGRAVPRALLATLVGQADEDLLKVLDTLCRARLLEEQGGDAYQFAHDIIRDVVEADLGAARRSVVHRRVAEALERYAEPPVDLLAYHYGCSDRHDKAAYYLEQAGDHATAHYAHSAALAYYREAVARLDLVGRRHEAAGVYEKLGAVLKTVGQYDQALLLLEQAVTIHRAAGALEAEARVVAVIGEVHFLAGTWEAGLGRIRQLIPALEARGPSSALAALYITCIPLFAPMGRYRDYLATAERASELARSLRDACVLAKSETWRGVALVEMDRPRDARPILEGAVALADGVKDLVSLSRALSFLGTTYLAEGAFVQALACRERACATSELEGNLGGVAWTTSRLADVHTLLGNWAQARALYERAIGIYRGLSGSRHAAVPLVGLGVLSLHEGAGAEAGRYLEEGLALAARTSHLGAFRQAQIGLAEKELREGAPQAALTRLQSLSHLRHLEASVLTVPPPVLAWVHLELGHLSEAEDLIVGGVGRARGRRDNRSLVEWLWLQGMARLCRGCWQEARCTLDVALMLARGMPYPYAEARLLHTGGLCHLRRGEHGPARDQLQSALTIFQRLGARNHVEEAEHVLAALPHP